MLNFLSFFQFYQACFQERRVMRDLRVTWSGWGVWSVNARLCTRQRRKLWESCWRESKRRSANETARNDRRKKKRSCCRRSERWMRCYLEVILHVHLYLSYLSMCLSVCGMQGYHFFRSNPINVEFLYFCVLTWSALFCVLNTIC